MDKLTLAIKKLSLKKGDIIIAHPELQEQLRHLAMHDIDFVVPIIFTDDLNKIKAHHKIEKLILGEEEVYGIIITQLPMAEYLSIPSHKLKTLAHQIYEAQKEKVNEEYRRVIKDPNKSGNY